MAGSFRVELRTYHVIRPVKAFLLCPIRILSRSLSSAEHTEERCASFSQRANVRLQCPPNRFSKSIGAFPIEAVTGATGPKNPDVDETFLRPPLRMWLIACVSIIVLAYSNTRKPRDI